MTSRRFWTLALLFLAVFDIALRFLLNFDFNAILKAESFLFTVAAGILFLRLRREDSTDAWPRWVRSVIIAGLLLAVVHAGSCSLGLELHLANLTTLAIAIIAAVGSRWRSGGRGEGMGSRQVLSGPLRRIFMKTDPLFFVVGPLPNHNLCVPAYCIRSLISGR
jgi:hypothetical protein